MRTVFAAMAVLSCLVGVSRGWRVGTLARDGIDVAWKTWNLTFGSFLSEGCVLRWAECGREEFTFAALPFGDIDGIVRRGMLSLCAVWQ